MIETGMSQGVTKLKQLLFDHETETLADLARRIELLAANGVATRQELLAAIADSGTVMRDELRAELARAIAGQQSATDAIRADLAGRLDGLAERVGNDDRMARSVANVIDRAIVEAERGRHDDLANAVAPVVIKTVKTEIVNSRDDIVEAIYPMTGQMVRAYVASAMKDLVAEVNRRLEQNPLMLRLRSLTTGRSMAELAIADTQRLAVEELLLIRRGSGELLARWPERVGQTSASNHDHVLGGVLTAINSFVSEALESNENALRQIDLGQSQVYLRASPALLLAARCSGSAAASIEQIIDDEFLATVARIAGVGGDHGNAAARGELASLGDRLGARIGAQYTELASPAGGVSPLKLVAVLVGLPLLAWPGWSSYVRYATGRVRDIAAEVIPTSSEIKGYPTRLTVAPRGRSLTMTGLAPSMAAQQALSARLAAALPGTQIDNQLAVLPASPPDATPEVAALRRQLAELSADVPRQIAQRALDRVGESFAAAAPELQQLRQLQPRDGANLGAGIDDALVRLSAARKSAADAQADLQRATPDAATAAALAARLRGDADAISRAADRLSRSGADAKAATSADAAAASTPVDFGDSAERLAAQAQRLASLAAALKQAALVRAAIPPPSPPPLPVVKAPEPTALDRLGAFIRTNAIFFANDTDLRDATVANAQLDRIAALVREAQVLIRVVGYTDVKGPQSRNTSLSQQRAAVVFNALRERGVPPELMVTVGREASHDISPDIGPTSANRRVEFEIGFIGEGGPR